VEKQSIFLSVHLLITNFILAIVKKYDPFLFNQVLFHVRSWGVGGGGFLCLLL
jgi:hypothetical protein